MKNETPRIMRISAKCSDMFSAQLNGKDYSGYVPAFFPNPKEDHYGDYVQLDIDIDTGMIKNWKKPTEKQLKDTFEPESECEN